MVQNQYTCQHAVKLNLKFDVTCYVAVLTNNNAYFGFLSQHRDV